MHENAVSGTFEVTMTPATGPESPVGRLTLSKRFEGDLQATSVGEMLAVGTGNEGSAGYVAMESVTGTLSGHRGTFALQHSGTMDRGKPTLIVSVVPDSGTEELTGLGGTMSIDIVGGEHRYTFRYTLPN